MKTVIAIDPGVNTGIVVAAIEEEVEILHFDQFICSTHNADSGTHQAIP